MTSRSAAASAIGWPELVAVLVGGMLGTGIRFAVDVALPPGDGFPLGTLVANVAGSFALGYLVGGVWSRPSTPNWLKAGLGVGALGSFTTFSAVMVSLVDFGQAGEWMLALGYLIATVVLGLAAAALGLHVAGTGAGIGSGIGSGSGSGSGSGLNSADVGFGLTRGKPAEPIEPDWVDE